MRHPIMLTAALLGAASPLAPQPVSFSGPEIRTFVGAYVPTGAIKSQFRTSSTLGAQYAYEMAHNFHMIGSVSWSYNHSRLAGLSDDRVSIWQYDIGAEVNLVRTTRSMWLFRPFVGAGGGRRTYDSHASGVGLSHCPAGYGALGTELQRGTIAWRFEARDYLSCYRSPGNDRADGHNDLTLSLGAAWHFR